MWQAHQGHTVSVIRGNTGKTPLTHLGWHLPRLQAMFLPSEFELHFIIKNEMLVVLPYL